MPRLGLSYAAVKEAAERLEAQGLSPTVMRVRTEAGGTGSLSTIARHLKEWRQASGQGLSVTGLVTPSPFAQSAEDFSGSDDHVPAEVGQIARSAWQRLADLAGQEVNQAQAACEADKAATHAEAQQRIAQAERQAKDKEDESLHRLQIAQAAQAQAESQAQAERAERIEAQQAHAALATQMAAEQTALQSQLAAATARADELSKRLSTSEIGRHKAEEARELAIERQRSSEAQSQARMDKAAHVEQQRLASATQSFERLISSLRQDEAKARAALCRHQEEASSLKERLSGQDTMLQDARRHLRDANDQVMREQQALRRMEKQMEEMTAQAHELRAALQRQTSLQPSMASLQQLLSNLEQRLESKKS